ncbi:hypothetical protein Tco_0414064 [Tanacetum coccineum]
MVRRALKIPSIKGFSKGLQIYQSPRDIFINQFKYDLDILKKHGINKCDSIGTPMATSPKLDADLSGTPIDQTIHHSMIGPLMNLSTSRPDLVHATCFLPRYQDRPPEKHPKEVKPIFQYLKRTINMELWYPKDFGFELTAFSNNDHAVQHSRTKHIAIRYHFIKERVKNGIVELYFVRTEYQLGDMFTKALLKERFENLVGRLSMRCLTLDELEVLANEPD